MAADIRTHRNSNYKEIKKKFDNADLFIPYIGRDFDRERVLIDPATGTWADRSFYSKTPGYVVQFELSPEGVLRAGQFVPNGTTGKLGYLNTTNPKNIIGGIAVRVFPVFRMEGGQFDSILQWEWSLVIIFSTGFTGGSSADTLNNFAPPNKMIDWKTNGGHTTPIEIATASLFGLVEPESQYVYAPNTDNERIITYSDASNALNDFLSIEF